MLHLLNRRFTVYRRTGYVLDPVTLAASHAASRTPGEAYAVEVEVSGSGTPGLVTVAGTSSGAPASQVLTFGAAGRQATTRLFDASTAPTITTSGWSGTWTISARATRKDGHPLRIFSTVQTGWPGRTDRRQGRWDAQQGGTTQVEEMTLFIAFTSSWEPREGDEFLDAASGERWRVEAKPRYDDFSSEHHWECRVARAEE